jgi:hypothetical protein
MKEPRFEIIGGGKCGADTTGRASVRFVPTEQERREWLALLQQIPREFRDCAFTQVKILVDAYKEKEGTL